MTVATPFPSTATSIPRDVCARWAPALIGIVVVVWLAGYFAGFSLALAILTTIALLATLAGVSWPALGLLGISMLCTLDSLTRFFLLTGGLLRWNTVNYLLLFFMFVFLPVTLRITDIHTRILAALFLLMLVQLSITSSLEVGAFALLNVSAAFGLLVCVLRAADDPQAMVWVAWLNGVLSAGGGLIYFLQFDQLPAMNHNAWSQFPLSAIFAVCLAFPFAGRRSKVWLAALAIISGVWVFLSGSRGGILIGTICILYLFLNINGYRDKLKLIVASALIASTLVAAFGEFGEYAENRVGKLFDTERSLESRTSGRSDLARAGWYFFRQHPLGIGTGGFAAEFAGLHNDEFDGRDVGAHSAWLRTIAENGVLGLVLITAYVFSFAAVSLNRRLPGLRGLGVLVSLILASAFVSREFHSKGLWFVAVVYAALSSPEYAAFRGERKQQSWMSPGQP